MIRSLALLFFAICFSQAMGQQFTLQKGDRISLLGNTLAERMQHHGHMETMLHNRLPEHDLSIRNLGFSGDELTLRLRSQGFGSPEDWLNHTKADVVFAFFGYNESFAGQQGLEKFEKDLDGFLKGLASQKFNGKSAPRVVLFSPIAHENLKDPNLPDGSANNARLEIYTKAMAKVGITTPFLWICSTQHVKSTRSPKSHLPSMAST